ncbi:Fur family transcriptional regulator [Rivihabitans pingtungensis]|uniref:Fur family transcriptional regulator n=1 Tax=Rivihabitans pingtungensis TaxID=1054498 RepID=UPI0023533383|nr:transcriptional repressor [Rivihabitans pingtungensis]MCK6436418.1 transcriptional repressor [Rivihabitans pingtungensis]
MPTLLPSLPDVSGHLLRAGIPVTAQRLAIARVLLPQPVHLSAEQVQQCASHYTSGLSRATVYNTLKLFTARGLLRELAVEPGKTMFDSNPLPHHHLYNSATGELTDIPADTLRLSGVPVLPDGLELEQIEVIVRVRPREDGQSAPRN